MTAEPVTFEQLQALYEQLHKTSNLDGYKPIIYMSLDTYNKYLELLSNAD